MSAKFLLDLSNLTLLNNLNRIIVNDGLLTNSVKLIEISPYARDPDLRQAYIYTTSNKMRISYSLGDVSFKIFKSVKDLKKHQSKSPFESYGVKNTPIEQNTIGIIPVTQGKVDLLLYYENNMTQSGAYSCDVPFKLKKC